MTEITITIPGKPLARKAHKLARVGKFLKPILTSDAANYQNLVAMAANQAMNGNPPLSVPCWAEVMFIFPAPQSLRAADKKRVAANEMIIYAKDRHDLDNLCKNLFDGLKGIAIADDCLIHDLQAGKRIGAKPCTIVTIRPIE